MSTVPKFRIDVDVHSLLMNSQAEGPELPVDKGMSLPEPVYPRFPQKLLDPGPETPPDHRDWTLPQAYHKMKGWLFPYVRSRVLPGEFHPIIAYLFVESAEANTFISMPTDLIRFSTDSRTEKSSSTTATRSPIWACDFDWIPKKARRNLLHQFSSGRFKLGSG